MQLWSLEGKNQDVYDIQERLWVLTEGSREATNVKRSAGTELLKKLQFEDWTVEEKIVLDNPRGGILKDPSMLLALYAEMRMCRFVGYNAY